jgi:hypothetical protein
VPILATGTRSRSRGCREIHSCATHDEMLPAVVVGEVSVGTFEESSAKFEIVRSSAIVAPREDPILTHPIAP